MNYRRGGYKVKLIEEVHFNNINNIRFKTKSHLIEINFQMLCKEQTQPHDFVYIMMYIPR